MIKREELIFTTALQVPRAERMAFIERVCGPELELSERLKDLIEGLDEAGSFLEEAAPDVRVATKALRQLAQTAQ